MSKGVVRYPRNERLAMNITERVSYLKGLMEGLKIDDSTNEGKVIKVIADVLEDMAKEISDLREDHEYLNDYIEEIDDDLADVEDDLDELYDDEADCDDDDDDEDDDDEYGDLFEITCPSCGETIYLDDTIDPSKIVCPACNAEFSEPDDK